MYGRGPHPPVAPRLAKNIGPRVQTVSKPLWPAQIPWYHWPDHLLERQVRRHNGPDVG
jgi:hypothetical protein